MWTASFLYETPTKLNLFIQISLNATTPPPPQKKARLNIFAFVWREKKNSCFRVYYYGLQVLSTSHLFEKLCPWGKVDKIRQGQAITLMYILWCIRN